VARIYTENADIARLGGRPAEAPRRPRQARPEPKAQAAEPERRNGDPAASVPTEALQGLFDSELLADGAALYLADLDGRLQWCNEAFRRLVGDDGKALPLSDIAADLRRAGDMLMRQDTIGAIRLRSRHSLLKGVGGVAIGIAGVVSLLTAEAKREESAAHLRDHLDDIVRLTSDWIWETDPTLNLTSVSQRIFDILGFHPREIVGRNLLTLAADGVPPRQLLQNFANLAPFREVPFEVLSRGGERRFFELSAVPVFDRESGALKGFRGSAKDMTLLRQREAGLRAARDAAEGASRAKSEFLANTSHELRTPLNAIIGFAEILKLELHGSLGDPQYRAYAADIHGSAEQLLRVINDILEMAHISAGKLSLAEELIDPREIVAAAIRMSHDRAEKARVALDTLLPAELPRLIADGGKLKRILVSLLSNAVKFTPPDGRATISARLQPDGDLVIAVADTGVGIARGDLERIWEPFTQADGAHTRKYEGTGLGLPLARALTELHGGTLELDSEPGVGTTVTLRLPAARVVRR
jgi:PAS domain S-box-containing protein